MAWYKDWFDSPLYDKLYAHRDDEEASKLANLIQKRLPPERYPTVLDLACGRGRHSINLAKRGYYVTGADLSPNAVSIAKEKANKQNLDITFIRHDMRQHLPERYHLIVNLFTSFGYFEDDSENQLVINAISEMLEPNGMVVIDYLNCNRTAKGLVHDEHGELDGLTYSIQRWIEDDMVFKKMTFVDNDNNSHTFHERVKLYNKAWFESAFHTAGLEPVNYFGNYEGDDFHPEHSPRFITIARKTA